MFGIVEKMRMPDKTDFLWSLSGAKRFLLEILVSSVEKTDPRKLEDVEMSLRWYKKLTGADSINEFIQNPKLHLSQQNNEIGFTVEVWQSFEDIAALDYLDLLYLSTSMENKEGLVHEAIQNEGLINIGLVFTTLDNAMPPHTALELKCEKSRFCTPVKYMGEDSTA